MSQHTIDASNIAKRFRQKLSRKTHHYPDSSWGDWPELVEREKDLDAIRGLPAVWDITPPKQPEPSLNKAAHRLAKELCERYPNISTYEGVFKGKPHLTGTRFTVADVISAICVHGPLKQVIEHYDNRYTEKQFQDALRYVRDFLLDAMEDQL